MLKRVLRNPKVLAAVTVLSVGLILFGGINGIAAAPSIQSRWFGGQLELDDIDVMLLERSSSDKEAQQVHGHMDDEVDRSDGFRPGLLNKLVPEGEEFEFDKAYTEELSVKNALNKRNNIGGADGQGGSKLIKEYVRVTVYRYWETKQEDGSYKKNPNLDPSKIQIAWANDSKWKLDPAAHTQERDVLYYDKILYPNEVSSKLTDTVTISSDVKRDPSYKGARPVIWAEVDAIQTHNAKEAMMSAWGVNNLISVNSTEAESIDTKE